jgi:hypothetical protein
MLNVNSNEVIAYTAKLEKLHKSDFPIAVRNALTSTAFEMKQKTLPNQAERTFKKRHSGNAWKRFTKVTKADGFDINRMFSDVHFTESKGSDFSENQLTQSQGGKIKNRSFVARDNARAGSGKLKAPLRPSAIKNIIDARTVTSRRGKGGGTHQIRSGKAKFVTAAIAAKQQYGNKAYVLSQYTNKKGGRTLFKIDQARRTRSGLNLKYTAIHDVKGKRHVKVGATNYILKAAEAARKQLPDYYIKAAQARFEKRLSK